MEAVCLLSVTGSHWIIVRDWKLLNYCQGLQEAVELLSGTGSCWTIVRDWKLLKCSHVMMKRGVFITLFKMHCCYYFKYHLYCARVEILRLALWSGERMYYIVHVLTFVFFSQPANCFTITVFYIKRFHKEARIEITRFLYQATASWLCLVFI